MQTLLKEDNFKNLNRRSYFVQFAKLWSLNLLLKIFPYFQTCYKVSSQDLQFLLSN